MNPSNKKKKLHHKMQFARTISFLCHSNETKYI